MTDDVALDELASRFLDLWQRNTRLWEAEIQDAARSRIRVAGTPADPARKAGVSPDGAGAGKDAASSSPFIARG